MISDNFKHKEIGVVGVNGKPFVELDDMIDTGQFDTIHQEILLGLCLVEKFDHAFVMGEIPPELRAQYGNMKLESEIVEAINEIDTKNIHSKNLAQLNVQQKRRYYYLAFGALPPWYGTCYLKYNQFLKKTSESDLGSEWTENSQYFPQLVNFIQSLRGQVFDEIGRVLFFISYPMVPTVVHRDYIQEKHKDHSINLFINKGRPSFIYDEVEKKKIYLNPNCRAYFFNNRDYHGVDAENEMRYTLRIDGTFTKVFQEMIGLKDGWVC